jgi:hypothetical protein
MKTLLLTSLVAAAVSSGFAQGNIDVGNHFGATVWRAPLYGPEPNDPGLSIVGQPPTIGFPTGTTVYSGARLQGPGFTFGFYASTTGITADPNSLSLIGTLPFGSTAGTAGFVSTATLNVPGVLAGNRTTWQIRVWDNAGGTITNYANAVIRAGTPMIDSAPLGGIGPGGVFLNPNTAGWTSFNIYANAIVTDPAIMAALLNGSQLQLNWPTNTTGYALESTTSLAAPTWATVTNTPTVIGNQFTLTVETAVGSKFYRLRKP